MFTFEVTRDDGTVFMTITVRADDHRVAARVIPTMVGMHLVLV